VESSVIKQFLLLVIVYVRQYYLGPFQTCIVVENAFYMDYRTVDCDYPLGNTGGQAFGCGNRQFFFIFFSRIHVSTLSGVLQISIVYVSFLKRGWHSIIQTLHFGFFC